MHNAFLPQTLRKEGKVARKTAFLFQLQLITSIWVLNRQPHGCK